MSLDQSEDAARRQAILKRINKAVSGEDARLAIEALLDQLAIAIIVECEEMERAAAVIAEVTESLARRVGNGWDHFKPRSALGSETLQ